MGHSVYCSVAVCLQAGGAKENVSVLVIRLNTDRGPSLARLRPTRQVMSIDDVEAAMAHDAALKAQRAARAEREAAVAALTSAATAAQSAVHNGPSPRSSTSQPTAEDGMATGLSATGSSLSGYTARMSFASSDGGGNVDETTPRNSSVVLCSTAANSSTLSPSLTSTAKTSNSPSSSSSTLSGQTLRLNFPDDDEDELMKTLIKRASQLSSESNNDDEDVSVDDRFVRDIIRAELPPPPPSSSFAADVAASSVQRQTRRRQRPTPVDQDHPPSAVDPPTTPQKPRFVKKSSAGLPAAAELGGPMSLHRNRRSSMDASATAAQPPRRFASSLPRSLVNHNVDVDSGILQTPRKFIAAELSSDASQSPATFGRRSPPPTSYRRPVWNSNVTKPTPKPKPTLPIAGKRFGDAQLHQHGDTQFFVEVARF